jgi:hypothetical protein
MSIRNKKPLVVLTGLTILFLMVSHVISWVLMREVPGADFNMVYRQIETTDKLIFNGFLAHFFRFKTFGIINLLIIPFLVRDLLRYRKLVQWQKAFLFIYVSVLIVVGLKGFFNQRYTLTLFPISVGYLIYSVWHFLESKKLPAYARLAPFFMAFLALYGFGKEYLLLKFEPEFSKLNLVNQTYDSPSNGTNIEEKNNKTNTLKAGLEAVFKVNLPHYKYNPNFYDDYPNTSQRKIFEFISENGRKNGPQLLTNNLPSVYYYTDVYALYYWAGDDLIYDNKGQWPLLKNRTNDQVRSFLVDSMNIGYIYTYEPYNKYNDQFYAFLHDECDLLMQTFDTYQLFKIKMNNGAPKE